MLEAYVDQDQPVLAVVRTDRRLGHSIPLKAIASHAALLGYTDVIDAVEAIVRIREHGEPEADPVTRENVWTEAHAALTEVEATRERAAAEAVGAGTADDPRSPKLRAAVAISRELPDVAGPAGILNQCRDRARTILGTPAGTTVLPLSRSSRMTCSTRLCGEQPGVPRDFCAEDRQVLSAALRPHLGTIQELRAQYLHSLTGNTVDPLTPAHEVQGPMTLDVLRRRYRNEAADAT